MKYYISRHEYINLKKGEDFAGLLHRNKSDQARYAIDVAVISSCFSCSKEFILEEKNEHVDGDFCDFCLKIHAS